MNKNHIITEYTENINRSEKNTRKKEEKLSEVISIPI